jgi:hypothetical protein
VRELNKKVLVIAAVLMAVAMLATTVMAKTYGKGLTVETFTITTSDPSTLTLIVEEEGNAKLHCNGTFRNGHGAFRTYDYVGPLGTGTLYQSTQHSKTYYVIPYVTVYGVGGGIYEYTLVIDDGPYGSGTLKGIAKLEWDVDMRNAANMPPVFYYYIWETAKLEPVEGDLDLKWVSIEGIMVAEAPPYPPTFGYWWTTTTVVS